jgi:RNA polymerase sigma-70 factor (ECF subfamily)
VYRFARARGVQHADAEDLAQQVIATVSRAIGTWRKEASRGTFRGWLLAIARNELVNLVTRTGRGAARGGTSVWLQIESALGANDAAARLIDDEHRRAVFRLAAEQVRPEFHDSTWRVFWLTTVDGRSVEEAAAMSGKTPGAVYAARSRVMRRLKEKVRELDSG